MQIIPSIIALNDQELKERITKVDTLFHVLQLDVMDGQFVPTHSLDYDFTLPKTKARFEAHLMMKHPESWIAKHGKSVDMIIVHAECFDPIPALSLAKSMKKKLGIALNPDTPIEKIIPFIKRLNQILIMTVQPGYYGATFLPNTLKKVEILKKMYPKLIIEVDGGISPATIGTARKAGATKFVCGSFLQKSDNLHTALDQLMKE